MTKDELYNLAFEAHPTLMYEEAKAVVDAIEPVIRKDERRTGSTLNKAILRDYRIQLREKLLDNRRQVEEGLEKAGSDFGVIIGNVAVVVLNTVIQIIEEEMKGVEKK